MIDLFERVDRFIEAVLAGRRPIRFRVEEPEDLGALQLAARLASDKSAAAASPDEAFLTRLRRQIEGQTAGGTASMASRRGVLAAGLAGLAVGLAGGFGLGRTPPEPAVPQQAAASTAASFPLVRDNGRWFAVARFAQLSPTSPLRFTAGALDGHLVRQGEEVLALSALCSHLPCNLVWQQAGQDFLCPCHDATFRANGEFKEGRRSYDPLTRFRVKVEDGTVLVWSIGADQPRHQATPL